MDVICTKCRGAKEYIQLGNILGRCTLCQGKGRIEEDKAKQAQAVERTKNAVETNQNEILAIYQRQEKDAYKQALKSANVAHMNRPLEFVKGQKNDAASIAEANRLKIPGHLKQSPSLKEQPPVLHHDDPKLAKLREQTAPRKGDLMKSQNTLEDTGKDNAKEKGQGRKKG